MEIEIVVSITLMLTGEQMGFRDIFGWNHYDFWDPKHLKTQAKFLSFGVEEFTLRKIARLRKLLSRGLTLRTAQEVLRKEFGEGLSWKNIEKYKFLTYAGLRVLIMPRKGFLRDYPIVFGHRRGRAVSTNAE